MPAIAYLTSLYPRPSDSFIRGEVAQLRALGWTVETFSVRQPTPDLLVSEDIRHEHGRTTYLLRSPLNLLIACFWCLLWLFLHPHRTLPALALVRRLSWPGLKGRLWPLAYFLEALLLARHLRRRHVVHLHNHIGENSAAVALLASALAGIPYSLTIHGPYEFDDPQRLALALKIRHAAFVAAISNFTRSQLCRWTDPADWKKIHIVHCGVAPAFLHHPAIPLPRSSRLVCVGRLCPEKGQLVLLEALAQLMSRGPLTGAHGTIELVLVGDGPSRSALEAAIDRLNLRGHVTITGWMSADQVREQILLSRGLVLASFNEGLPVVLMEALALRRPVVSTWIAGTPELVQPGINGWLVPPGNPEKLVAALREWLAAPDTLLERFGEIGAARVHEFHNARTEAQRLARLIAQAGGLSLPMPLPSASAPLPSLSAVLP